jgi:hypothetical protein
MGALPAEPGGWKFALLAVLPLFGEKVRGEKLQNPTINNQRITKYDIQ